MHLEQSHTTCLLVGLDAGVESIAGAIDAGGASCSCFTDGEIMIVDKTEFEI